MQRSKSNNNQKQMHQLDMASRCTRDDQINVDDFMRHDLRMINKEEEKLQRELMEMQKKNLHKHHKVLK